MITAIIIAKNEEEIIADAIDSVSFCDQIIVVDNNSTDRTTEVAKLAKVEVVSSNLHDFSALRNLGLKKAKEEWVLYIDADERVSSALQNEIKSEIRNPKSENISAYKLKRKNFYLGNHEWPTIEEMPRLFKRLALKEWHGKLHETPVYEGKTEILNNYLLHYTHRDLSSMVEKTIEWSGVEAKLRFDAHHPKMTWWRFPRVMIGAFFYSYIKQKGYKAGTAGIVESFYQSFSIFITYARLWEMQEEKKNKTE